MQKSLWAALLVMLLVAIGGLSAQDFVFQEATFPSARSEAMGGMHVALADDISTLLSNPAGFRSAGPEFSVTELTANVTGPVFSIADVVMSLLKNANPLTLLTDPSTASLFTSLYTQALLNGPISFGYVGDGLGFGFFNTTGVTFSTQGTVPTLTAGLHEDLLFVGGYAFRIPLPDVMRSTLDLGVSVKAFARGGEEFSESILDIFSLLTSGDFTALLNKPFYVDVGFGVDSGILYSWNKTISIGIVGKDLYAPVVRNTYSSITAFGSGASATQTYGSAPINLSAGILFSPGSGTRGTVFLQPENRHRLCGHARLPHPSRHGDESRSPRGNRGGGQGAPDSGLARRIRPGLFLGGLWPGSHRIPTWPHHVWIGAFFRTRFFAPPTTCW